MSAALGVTEPYLAGTGGGFWSPAARSAPSTAGGGHRPRSCTLRLRGADAVYEDRLGDPDDVPGFDGDRMPVLSSGGIAVGESLNLIEACGRQTGQALSGVTGWPYLRCFAEATTVRQQTPGRAAHGPAHGGVSPIQLFRPVKAVPRLPPPGQVVVLDRTTHFTPLHSSGERVPGRRRALPPRGTRELIGSVWRLKPRRCPGGPPSRASCSSEDHRPTSNHAWPRRPDRRPRPAGERRTGRRTPSDCRP
jgi:hypothetical protein